MISFRAFVASLLFFGALAGCESNGAGEAAQDGGPGDSGGATDGSVTGDLEDGGAFDATPGDSGASDSGAGDSEGTIAIYLTGDETERAFDDGLSGQTPRGFAVAVSKYYILTSADDPAPVLCFDRGDVPAVAELSDDTQVGACQTATVPTAVYTHGRVKVDWSRYTVEGTVHYQGRSFPGDITIWRAYSDTDYEGESYTAGAGVIAFSGLIDREINVVFGALPPLSGIDTELVDGELWMTFPYTHPLRIVQGNTDPHWARFHWETFEGFRWRDDEATDYLPGVWDVGVTVDDTEALVFPGVTRFYVTSSTD